MVLRDLASTLKVEIVNLRWVDEEDRQSQAIELEAHTTGPILSFEHTRVEAYGGQIGDGQQFLDLVWKLEESPPDGLRGPLRVAFELFATRRLKASEIPAVIGDLARWLVSLVAHRDLLSHLEAWSGPRSSLQAMSIDLAVESIRTPCTRYFGTWRHLALQ